MHMEKKKIYKVTVHNSELTTVHFVADNQIEATLKYRDWLENHCSPGFLDENMSFDIDNVDSIYL